MTATLRENRRNCLWALFLLLFSIFACRDSNAVSELSHSEFSVVPIRLSALAEDPAFGIPWTVHVLNDSMLLIVDMREPYYHVLSRDDGEVRKSFGRAGRGPGEYVSYPQVITLGVGAQRWIAWTRELSRLTLVDISSPDSRRDSTISVRYDGSTNNPLGVLGDTVVILTSASDSAGMISVDFRTGAILSSGVPMRFMDPDSLTPPVRRSLPSNIVACMRPAGDRIFRASRIAGRAEITNVTMNWVDTLVVPYSYDPIYEYDHDHGGGWAVHWNPKQRRAYQSCTATSDFIFALFSGRLLGAYESQYEQLFASYIHVFDWSGQLVAVLRLNQSVWSLSIDPSTNILYATQWDPAPRVVMADISETIAEHFTKH